MPKRRAPYPPEFRAEAIRLVRSSGKPMAQIARELEVTSETLRVWTKQADIDDGQRHDGATTEETEEVRRLRREVKTLREEREATQRVPPSKRGLLRQGDRHPSLRRGTRPVTVFAFVEREQAHYAIALLCRVLGVSSSGYYAWRNRGQSLRAQEDIVLTERITAIHKESRATYGAPRIHAELKAEGRGCGRKRVARLMQAATIVGCHRRRRTITTVREPAAPVAPDRVAREVVAPNPNVLWSADITFVPTWMGFLSLAVVLDVFSRRIIGWAMADHLRTELVVSALDMALWNRHPDHGVIHHSDRGCQYTSIAFGARCQEAGIDQSMGSVGDCDDNAITESFFATLECELLDRSTFRTHTEARTAIFDFIEAFYNTQRRHSSLGYLSPAALERAHGVEVAA